MSNIIDFFHEPEVLTKEFLHQKYVVEGLSCAEISRSVASSRTTILKRLKECNIELRPVGSNQKRKRGVGYGEKVEKRKLIEHKRESEAIQRMIALREKGFSYRKIAEVLNTMKVPTKTGKGKWHGKTVHQVLMRLEAS
ncbi:recombinase domain protein [Halobacteriovorax sp. BALOs_7]|uniref:recombinase family protein n=1 Tax=Halobacteriovorax sp. BALOs_7 TaxID=2109558 RepID=UPI000EA0CBD3|nr:recombinase family protein [Halobacteriovorax sp. BALOs_7]AYF45740.1 recombinase domain protein [Halobacteriovorax sp. BALOs_7]